MKAVLFIALVVLCLTSNLHGQLDTPETAIGKITYRALANLIDLPGLVEELDVSPQEFELLKAARTEVSHRKDLRRTEDFDRAAEELMRRILGADQLRQYSRRRLLLSFSVNPVMAFDDDAFATLFNVPPDSREKYRQICKERNEVSVATKHAGRKAAIQSEIAVLGETVNQKCSELFGPPFFDQALDSPELPVIDRLYDIHFLNRCHASPFLALTQDQEKQLKQLHKKHWPQWLAVNSQFSGHQLEQRKKGLDPKYDDTPLRNAKVAVRGELMRVFTRQQHSEITRLVLSEALQRDLSLPFASDEVFRYLGLTQEERRTLIAKLQAKETELRKAALKADLDVMKEFVATFEDKERQKFFDIYGGFEEWDVDFIKP